jgi:hypothetical protein
MIPARVFYALMGDPPDLLAPDLGARPVCPKQLIRMESMNPANAAAPPNILAQIWAGVEHTAETVGHDIELDGERVLAVLEGGAKAAAAALIGEVRQLAADALRQVAAGSVTCEPAIAAGIETVANSAINSVAAPLPSAVRLPLINFTDAQIDRVVAAGTASFQAWALKQKAALAANNPAFCVGDPVPAAPTPA